MSVSSRVNATLYFEAFKSHKKFIEKEVSMVVNKINTIKKTGSSKGG